MFINNINHVVQSKYRLMITAPLDYLDGFTLENVAPVAMGIWNSNSINTFIGNMVHVYNKFRISRFQR